MRHKTNTRSSLFLMELIIAILFFSLASAVCLRMFAKSHQLSTDASAQNQAVNKAGNVAELIQYDLENKAHTLSDEYPDADIIQSVLGNTDKKEADAADAGTANGTAEDLYNGSILYFDQNWDACSAGQAKYKLTIQAQDSSVTLRKYVLSIYSLKGTDKKNCIYELPLSIHIAREVAAHE